MASAASIKTYGMAERAAYFDFDIRRQLVRDPLAQPHRHDYFQIQVSLAGEAQQSIGGTVRPFGPGTLSFVLPYRVHLVRHPPGSRYVIVNFAQDFLWPELKVDPLDLEDVPVSQAPALAPFLFQEYLDFTLAPADFAQAQALLADMEAANPDRGFGAASQLRGLLLQLIALVCRRHGGALQDLAARHAKSSRRQSLRRVIRHLQDHLAEDLSLPQAAAAAHLSPNYLAHLLKKETGKTFVELLTERRMARAQRLLGQSGMQVAQIAHACGFADEAYFARRFRQHTGMSPTAWRARALAGAGWHEDRPGIA
ncbi:helix-turn-helix domain-containing protein [Bordetella genomosp. 1]|uniref:AraC family transcriptional regulator n=1 Tax=Bordetella genomosp. 1 TaxID=1395607 RepID=A0ABX4F013_9BORD|nr:AraC family transcriptional regulator [Bordetella genomosp. 1]MDQ8031253.1 AraC family transcriptional regulator [Bordetella sp.]OZI65345.1 AraC family transcriptional regulator [Bordetella genomosp. 1]